MYVKVIGHLKQFNKLRNVVAFKIRPVEDYNEVTHHLAEVMYCHLASTKSPPLVGFFWGVWPDTNVKYLAPFAENSFQQSSSSAGGIATLTLLTPWVLFA